MTNPREVFTFPLPFNYLIYGEIMLNLALLLAVGLGFLLGSLRLFVLALMAFLLSLYPTAVTCRLHIGAVASISSDINFFRTIVS